MARRRALITGASAGLGREFARLLAADGVDLVLVARGRDRLQSVADEVSEMHKVQAEVIAEDLADPGAPARIVEALRERELHIDILVNNAGFGSNGLFIQQDIAREAAMIEVNVTALVKLTHMLLPPMLKKGSGHVLNIASTAGFQPGPHMAVYFASKAFVVSFSEALACELRGSGVTVTCHCPGATATEFAARAGNDKSRLFRQGSVATAHEVALHGYQAMLRGQVLAIHGALNWVAVQALRFSPRFLVRYIAGMLNRPAA